jgi:putative transcriptional regulator
MKINPGTILISAPSLNDPNFEKVVIFIAEYNEKGALGFVINKLFPRNFNELTEFKNSKPFLLYSGGPVENENIFFLHHCPDIIKDGQAVIDSIYLGGNFKQAVAHLNHSSTAQNDIRLFIGYCGWDYNQLEEEIEEGSWLIANADTQMIFSDKPEMLWEKILNPSSTSSD